MAPIVRLASVADEHGDGGTIGDLSGQHAFLNCNGPLVHQQGKEWNDGERRQGSQEDGRASRPSETDDGSMKLLERTLKNMQTDHLDFSQLHNVHTQDQVDKIFAKGGAIEALERARSGRMVRFLGSTGHFEPLVLVNAVRRYQFDTILMALNAADTHCLSFIKYLPPEAQKLGMGVIGMRVATRGRVLSTWEPPPLEQQPERLRTRLRGTLTMKEALACNMTLPVSTTIVGVDKIEQLEQNVKWATELSPPSEEQMGELECRMLPIVRQALYLRRWDLGA